MANPKIDILKKDIAAKKAVQRLNKAGEAAIKGMTEGDERLLLYKRYVDRFYELKEKYPGWDRLQEPIEYSSFILDYDEPVYKMIGQVSQDFRGMEPIEIYTLKIHGINLRSISILQEKLNQLMPGSVWTNPAYFESHIAEAYQILREFYPNDEEYDQVFSPKETLFFGE